MRMQEHLTLRYGGVAVALHWLIALLVFAGLTLGSYMVDLRMSPDKLKLYSYHKWIGITVLLLACLRAAWRVTHAPPPPNPEHPLWQRRAASAAHLGLYLLLFVLPLSGWLFSSASGFPVKYFGLVTLPDLVGKDKELADLFKTVHELLGWALVLILGAHIAGALKHQFIDKDRTLARMWFGRRKENHT